LALDIATVGGLLFGWGMLVLSILVEANFDPSALAAYANLPGLMIIVGGTTGAVVISYTIKDLKNLPKILRNAFREKKQDPVSAVSLMVGFAGKARREGLLGLEEDIANIEDPFLKKGLQLVVDGTDMEMIREILETDTAFMASRHKTGSDLMTAAGGFAPTLGIIGAVAGLIHALGTVSDASKLTEAIAVAFTATFYGIGFANLIFLPLAGKLTLRSKEDVFIRELQIVGVLAISAGDNPRIVEEKMRAFMAPADRLALEATAEKAE
jgi:chemotaxis protein MotA